MESLSLIDLLVLSVSALLIISKFLDCITTQMNIHLGEGNPYVSPLMDKYGSKTVIWGIFTFVLLIVITSAAYYFIFPNIFYGISYVLLGTLIAVFQFAAAHYNYHLGLGRRVSNPVIRLTERLHQHLGRMRSRRRSLK